MPDTLLDRYADTVIARYQAELHRQLAELADPEVSEAALGSRALATLIETLAAFAIGHAVGRVVEALRRTDGSLADPLARALAAVRPPALPRTLPPPRHAGRRPIVALLEAELHQRLGLAASHVRVLVRAVAEVAAAHRRTAVLDNALAVLTDDPASGHLFGDQLALGWRFLVAVMTGAADPELPDEPRWQRGRALWTAWSRRIRGTPPARATREFILRVA